MVHRPSLGARYVWLCFLRVDLVRVSGHGVVELLEEGCVLFEAVLFGEAERLHAFDEDLGDFGLGF